MTAQVKLAESQLEKAMETLTSQWYNAVVTGCGLDPETFQLVQGNQSVGTTSEILWQYFDAIPPLSISNYFNPSEFSSFSSEYGSVINHLIVQGSDTLQGAMGDYYSQWLAYAKEKGVGLDVFKSWAMSVAPSQAAEWISLYRSLMDGPIFLAQEAWDNMLNASSHGGVRAYNKTIATLLQQLQSVAGKTVDMDNSTESSDISHTWAETEVGGFLEDFFGGGEASYSAMAERLATSHLKISAKFQNFLVFAAGPLAQQSSDPVLGAYTPWYNSAALTMAYQNNDNRVWQHGAPTWQGTFGPGGSMRRICSALVVVDGIEIEMTSDASFSSADQEQFQQAIGGGFFPFFEVEHASGWSHKASFNDQGQVTVKSSSPTGNPQVLGVIVTPIEQVL